MVRAKNVGSKLRRRISIRRVPEILRHNMSVALTSKGITLNHTGRSAESIENKAFQTMLQTFLLENGTCYLNTHTLMG